MNTDCTQKNNGGIGVSFGNIKSYMIGFIFSIILTMIPFLMVMYHIASHKIVYLCAILQVFVHLIYFLHLNGKSDSSWNTLALIFSLIIILIIVSGSLWIMWNLNHNMMMN